MNSHLIKLGLSDTKFQLKYHTPCSKHSRHHNQPSSSGKHNPNSTFKYTSALKNTHSHSPDGRMSVLDVLIGLVGRKQRETCSLPDHDRNAMKFICLSEHCPSKIGCSYCFLDAHKGHTKIQYRECLRDLTELQQRTQVSRGILFSELQIQRQELLDKIDSEVSIIKQEFMNSLEYINRKIKQTIESKFNEIVARLPTTLRQAAEDKEQNSVAHQQPPTDDPNDIISKFMSTSSKQHQPKPAIRTISQYPLHRDPTPYTPLSAEDEQRLLGKLAHLNLTLVEEYLKHETLQLREFMGGFRIFEEYYTQLTSSLSQFFAAFKRALPTLRTLEPGLQEPEVLRPFAVVAD